MLNDVTSRLNRQTATSSSSNPRTARGDAQAGLDADNPASSGHDPLLEDMIQEAGDPPSPNVSMHDAPLPSLPNPIFPSGSIQPFIGQPASGPPGPPRRHLDYSRPPEITSVETLPPNHIWTQIAETPFNDEEERLSTWRRYKKNPKRPIPRITSFSEHCKATLLPVSVRSNCCVALF
jgi:hypothetical protein